MSLPGFGKLILIPCLEKNVIEFIKRISQRPPDGHQKETQDFVKSEI